MKKSKTKSTPNQTYLNKYLVPKCQALFREEGIKGKDFAKHIEYVYAIIRHNTEEELDTLYSIVKENVGNLRAYIERNYPQSRTLDNLPQNLPPCTQEEFMCIKGIYVYKGLSLDNPDDNAVWFELCKSIWQYAIKNELNLDDVINKFGKLDPMDINNILTTRPKKLVIRDTSWIRPALLSARELLELEKSQYGEWNGLLMKLIWYCKKRNLQLVDVVNKIPKNERTKEKYETLLSKTSA